MPDKICLIEGCERKTRCKGVCPMHYHRLQRYGDPTYDPIKNRIPKKCSIEGCNKKSFCHDMCSTHYQRMYRRKNSKKPRAEYGIYKKYNYEAQSYLCMIRRCTDKNNPSYQRYGGAGIAVHPRWLGANGFSNFIKDMGRRPSGKTIDRIDNSKWYSPDNCRWSSVKEQNRNRKTNIFYTYNGEKKILTDWAIEYNLRPNLVLYRYHKGLRGKDLFKPPR